MPEILDEKEKEYLSSVIRPFRNKIEYICKSRYGDVGAEYLDIEIYDDFMCLPSFEKNTMYKGMKLEKNYTLEELGL